MATVRVKICGITGVEDAAAAVDAGADALGFVFYDRSPRHVTPEDAARIIRTIPPFVQTVGLFVNEQADRINRICDACGIDLVQLHGDETPDDCRLIRRRVMKAFRVRDLSSLERLGDYEVAGFLLDAYSPAAYGGTGLTFDWNLALKAHPFGRVILAGGLTPDNVAEAVAMVRPWGVDVSGGVEAAPGKKDHEKIRNFITRARNS